MMQAQLDQINARLIGCSNTEVCSSNFLNSKAPSGVQMGRDCQSLTIKGKENVISCLCLFYLFFLPAFICIIDIYALFFFRLKAQWKNLHRI